MFVSSLNLVESLNTFPHTLTHIEYIVIYANYKHMQKCITFICVLKHLLSKTHYAVKGFLLLLRNC